LRRSATNRSLHSFPTRRSSDLYNQHAMHSLCDIPCAHSDCSRPGDGLHRLDDPFRVSSRCTRALAYRFHLRGASDGGITTKVERSEEHTSELQLQSNLVCRLLH